MRPTVQLHLMCGWNVIYVNLLNWTSVKQLTSSGDLVIEGQAPGHRCASIFSEIRPINRLVRKVKVMLFEGCFIHRVLVELFGDMLTEWVFIYISFFISEEFPHDSRSYHWSDMTSVRLRRYVLLKFWCIGMMLFNMIC